MDREKFYINVGKHGCQPARHASLDIATAEAERMVEHYGETVGNEFTITESVGTVCGTSLEWEPVAS